MNLWALITGGTKGIGKALVVKFANENFNIVTCSRHQDALDDLEAEIKTINPNIILKTIKTDLSNQSDIKAFVNTLKTLNINFDVLINNAGIFIPANITSESDHDFETMLNTNLVSAYYISKSIVPNMIQQQKGHVFNICSTASIMAYPNGGSYCTTKFALYGMTKVLREELKHTDIKVTAVLPGATLTDSWKGTDLPFDRFLQADEIAHAVWNAYKTSANTVIEEILIRPQKGDI